MDFDIVALALMDSSSVRFVDQPSDISKVSNGILVLFCSIKKVNILSVLISLPSGE